MERMMGIEPTTQAWEAYVLPLYYTRILRITVRLPYATKLLHPHYLLPKKYRAHSLTLLILLMSSSPATLARLSLPSGTITSLSPSF